MFTGLVGATILTISLFTFPTPPQATSSAEIELYPDLIQEEVHRVKAGDSLESLAEKYYGDEKYWKILWVDNSKIDDPSYIEVGWILKLRQEVTEKDLESIKLPERMPKIQAAIFTFEPSPTSQIEKQPTQTIFQTSGTLSEAQITFLGICESGMRPATNTGNGYYGAFQFSIGTWNRMGTGYERADMAPLDVQKDAVQRLLSRSSIYTQFPACARKMRNAGLL